MTTKAIGAVVAVILGVVLSCAVFGAVLVGGVAVACAPASVEAMPVSSGPSLAVPAVDGFDGEQVADASVIVSAGAQLGVPTRGWVIAVAAAMQESNLRNLLGGDRDSVGLFQQRPSQGWGTPQQLHDPLYAATKFYQKLLTVPEWQSMPVGQAAQAAQHSATPDAYGKQEPGATTLVNLVASGSRLASPGTLEQCLSTCAVAASVDGRAQPSPTAECGTREAELARAATWLTAWNGGPVPYLMSSDPSTWFEGYRRDCSGFASMALGLPGPGLDTAGLANRFTPISKEELQPGDLLINPAGGGAGHVVIFDRWDDASMASYLAYEQSGDGGTHHRVIPYPYWGNYSLSPASVHNGQSVARW